MILVLNLVIAVRDILFSKRRKLRNTKYDFYMFPLLRYYLLRVWPL
jgi:hypothetical protein